MQTESKKLLLASLLFFFVLYTHASSKVVVSIDSMWSVYLAKSLIHDGDLFLDEYKELAKKRKHYGLRKKRNHLYSFFPVGTAIMASPLVYLYEQTPEVIKRHLPGFPTQEISESFSVENMHLPLQKIIAAFFVALIIVIIFYLACQELSIIPSIIIALIAAFCTSLWSTASRGLWQHGPSALLLSLSILLLTKLERFPKLVGFTGLILAYAYIVRPTNAVSFLFFGIYLFFHNKLSFRLFILTSLLIFIPFISISYGFFDKPLPPYYSGDRLGIGWHLPQALTANLISPNRGLFFLSPILIFALIPIYKLIINKNFSSFNFLILSCFLGHLFAVSLFPEWWGGHAFGPRYMTETVPFVIYFLILYFKDFNKTKLNYILISSSIIISFLIHLQGATAFRTYLWNTTPINIDQKPTRVWDIFDLQYLRNIK